MDNFLKDISLLFFRVTIGLFMMFGHGFGKLTKLLSGEEINFLDLFGIGNYFSFTLATLAEFFASALIVLGLFTRFSSLSLIITMAVAAFIAHADDPFSKKEMALLYLVSYVLIFLQGPGKYSINSLLKSKLNKSKGWLKFILE